MRQGDTRKRHGIAWLGERRFRGNVFPVVKEVEFQFSSPHSSSQTSPAVCLLVLWSCPKENKKSECKTCINVRPEQIILTDFSLSESQVTVLLDVKLALKCLEGHLNACILYMPFTGFVHKKATYCSICIVWIYSLLIEFS